MIDQLSGGRFQLGVGRGVSMYETAAYALDFAKTQAMYHEAFQVLLKGLTSDELSFKGEFYNFDKLPMILKPVQKPHPPLWYGVTLPSERRLAGREQRQHRRARAPRQHQRHHQGLSRHAREARPRPERHLDGREPAHRGRRYRRGGDGHRAPRLSALAGSFRWLFARHGTEPRVIGIYPPSFDDLMALNNGIAGSPETVRRFIAAEVEANGCNYFVPQMVFGDMTLKELLRSVELFAKEIMPAF